MSISINGVTVNNTKLSAASGAAPVVNYSNEFDGNGDYLSLASNAAFAMGTGDFTIESWIRLRSLGTISAVCQSDAVGISQNDKWWFGYFNNSLYFALHAGGASVNSAWTPTLNTWYHIAATKSSGTTRIFVDGVLKASTGTIGSLSQNGFTVGAISTPYYTNGYLSNVRLVKGTALYTSNFSVPTSSLTAVSGTSLLTCQSATFIDNSGNNFTVNKVGDTAISTINPFN